MAVFHLKTTYNRWMLQYPMPANVYGDELQSCCKDPMTGVFRDGFCNTCVEDVGMHTICAIMTDEFLEFSYQRGNDLITPIPEYDFPGLKAGDRWCLCLSRWVEALKANKAPKVYLEGTHISALEHVSMEDLRAHAVDKAV